MKLLTTCLLCLFIMVNAKAQYKFSGHANTTGSQQEVYLSLVEDYRKTKGVYAQQIIAKATTDNNGYFEFRGNQLEDKNRIYRIHIDHCSSNEQNVNHFTGHCPSSEEILFVASNKDTVYLPLSGNNQMFCNIEATNSKSSCFFKVDSLIEIMKFEYAEYSSNTSRKLNNRKWFHKIQEYGQELKEPLAELYIYNFLSDRTNNLHEYYLEDLEANHYYKQLETRLATQYPDTPYLKQYQTELNADLYSLGSPEKADTSKTNIILGILLLISVLGNVLWFFNFRKQPVKTTSNPEERLTRQERSVLELIVQDKTNKEIAEALFVSVSTVKTHINNIYKKLGVTSREEVKNL